MSGYRTTRALVPAPGHEGAHLDGNPANNKLSNLAWVTPKNNQAHKKLHGTYTVGERHVGAILTDRQVIEIKRLLKAGAMNMHLAEQFGVSRGYISHIKTGRARTASTILEKTEGAK